MQIANGQNGPKGIEMGATYALLVGSKVVAARVLGFPDHGGVSFDVSGKTINVALSSVERRLRGKIKSGR